MNIGTRCRLNEDIGSFIFLEGVKRDTKEVVGNEGEIVEIVDMDYGIVVIKMDKSKRRIVTDSHKLDIIK